jgi:uncharacterized protein YndB with AHSA1/START domain
MPSGGDMEQKQDRIEREIVVAAAIEVVWAALTEAAQVASWFGDVAEIELIPGGRARFGWSESNAVIEAVVEVVDRPRRFAYRWAVDSATPVEDGPSTLVEFSLEPAVSGTRVTVVESGLADLPDGVYESVLADNTSGWRAEFRDLEAFLALEEAG